VTVSVYAIGARESFPRAGQWGRVVLVVCSVGGGRGEMYVLVPPETTALVFVLYLFFGGMELMPRRRARRLGFILVVFAGRLWCGWQRYI
jgi:hypothetical protein